MGTSPGEELSSDLMVASAGAASFDPQYASVEGFTISTPVAATSDPPAAPAGSGGAAGSGGTIESDPAPGDSAQSVICGDFVRDPETEECDDGPGRDPDLCTAKCQVSDALVERQAARLPWEGRSRKLGEGRHPVAGHPDGIAVVYVEPDEATNLAQVGFSTFERAIREIAPW
jgi:hypothetical protein